MGKLPFCWEENVTNWPGSFTGSGRNISMFTRLKRVVFTPMPSPSDMIATAVNPGALRNPRKA